MTNATRPCAGCGEPLQGAAQQRFCDTACRENSRFRNAPTCSFADCAKKAKARGLCSGHAEQRRLGRPLTKLRVRPNYTGGVRCSFPKCVKYARSRGLCWGHAEQRDNGRSLADLRPRKPTNTHAARDRLGRKRCASCTLWLDLDQYTRRAKKADGYHYECKNCARLRYLHREFGLSREAYDEIFNAQGRTCAICRVPETGEARQFAVDHDHSCCPRAAKSCGRCIRGILCHACNMALGGFKDDPRRLRAALTYLGGWHERRVDQQR